ncbi:protein of unknown function [Tenacibaculum aestuariivivum]
MKDKLLKKTQICNKLNCRVGKILTLKQFAKLNSNTTSKTKTILK